MVLSGKRQTDLIRLCQELIRRPSLSGKEREVALFTAEIMRSVGYDDVTIDAYGNVIGRIFFATPGKRLLFESQMDHVDPGIPTDWSYYPYGAFIKNGCIYGRGASDQKGCLAAMIMAGAALKEDQHKNLQGEIVVAGTVFQERFEGISSRAVALSYPPDFVVIGEASQLEVERGQRGRAEIVIETQGRMAHSAQPEYGTNAADAMTRILSSIHCSFKPDSDPYLGQGILVLTNLRTFPEFTNGMVPQVCKATYDLRLLPYDTPEKILDRLQIIVNTKKNDMEGIRALIYISATEDRCYTGAPIRGEHFARAWVLPEDSFYLKKVLEGVEKAGLAPRLSESPGFGTNGCYYAGEMGIPTVAFGPSCRELAHTVDEYIEIEQLALAYRGYCGIAESILS